MIWHSGSKLGPFEHIIKGLKLEDFDSSKQAIMLSTKMSWSRHFIRMN